MNLADSVQFMFSIQSIFFVSVLDNTSFKPSKGLIRISLLITLLIVGDLVWYFYTEGPINEVDGNRFDDVTSWFSGGCQLLIMILTIVYRNKESTFYTELVQVDKILQMYGSLEETYQNFSTATRTIVLPILAQVCMGVVLFKIFDYSIMFREILHVSVYMFLYCALFIYTFVFYFNIKLLRDRFRLVKELTVNCFKMEEFEDLEKAHKSLIALMDGTNDAIGVKLGFVLISNFLSAVLTSFTVFVSFIVTDSKSNVYFNIFGLIVPHVIMLFMNFLSGEWITTDVSVKKPYFSNFCTVFPQKQVKDSLHALTNVPIYTDEAIAVKRKLHLKMKALSFGISAGKVIPLNLGILFAGFNILATYFVILLQFKTLTDDSLLQQSS